MLYTYLGTKYQKNGSCCWKLCSYKLYKICHIRTTVWENKQAEKDKLRNSITKSYFVYSENKSMIWACWLMSNLLYGKHNTIHHGKIVNRPSNISCFVEKRPCLSNRNADLYTPQKKQCLSWRKKLHNKHI